MKNLNQLLSLTYEFTQQRLHIFHINYDPPGEYRFVNHVAYVTRRYKGVVLDKWLHKLISLLAINK